MMLEPSRTERLLKGIFNIKNMPKWVKDLCREKDKKEYSYGTTRRILKWARDHTDRYED